MKDKKELKERLKARFTDDLSTVDNNGQRSWIVAFWTKEGGCYFDEEYKVYHNHVERFIEQVLYEGLIRLWIQPPVIKIFDSEEEND